ncbi:MAG: InlB B-repeat-containing protein [Clostridium sp.]|uniref:InlB B-repeat-containing protein n=1 Tax=Clostridium sp. TaxID=1506 RepID=UPI003D6CC2A0
MESKDIKGNKRTKKIILSILALIIMLCIGVFSVQAVQNGKVTKFVGIGNKYLLESKYDQAILQFEYALKINPKSVNARIGLAKGYIGLKKYDKVIVVLKEGIRILPKEPKFYLMLSDVFIIKGNTEDAIKTLVNGYDDTKDSEIKSKLNQIKLTISIIVEKDILQVGNDTTSRLVQKDKDGNVIKELNAEWGVKDSKVGSINKIDTTKANYKGKAVGQDEVTASIGKAEFKKSIEVKGVVLEKLEITGGGSAGSVGDTMKFNVIGYDQMGKVMEIVPVWSVNNDIAELVKTEGQDADVSYVKDGTFELTATVGDIKEKIDVTLQNKKYSIITIISGKGSIEKNPSDDTYLEDKKVKLTAVANVGWHFVKWTGSVTGSVNPVVVNIDGNKEIHAIFEIDQNILKTEVSGVGKIGRSIYRDTYAYGEVVRITAAPKNEYRFDHWEGDISGTNPVVDVKMNGYKKVKAVFIPITYKLNSGVVGNGSIKQEDVGVNKIKLTAIPGENSVFSNWEGDLNGVTNPVEVTMDKDKTVKAVFNDVKRVSGKITNSKDKSTITASVINIRTGKDNKTGEIYKSINSNEMGKYDTTLLKGDYTFEVVKSGFITEYINITLENSELTKDVVLNQIPEQEIYKLSVELVGKGSVKQENVGINKIKLTAIPEENVIFSHWEGDLTGVINPVEITMDKNTTVKAVFYDMIKVSGKVMNSKDQSAITTTTINIRTGSDNKTGAIFKKVSTNELGQYDVKLSKGGYTFEVIKDGFTTEYTNVTVEATELTQNIILNQIDEFAKYRIVLTWGVEPSDLDSYLMIPTKEGLLSSEVYYGNKVIKDLDGNETVKLDIDKTNGYGPETTTILSMETGKYSYYVKDFSSTATINKSNAIVKVYKNNVLANTFNVPTSGEVTDNRNYWHVFNIVKGKVVPINTTQSTKPEY